jgi:hypothetical protein
MSSNRNLQSDKNIIKLIPANLRQQLKDVNITPVDEGTIAKKLAERLSANVISYLQLTVLKLAPATALQQRTQASAQEERLKYINTLSQRVSVIEDS